MKLVENLNVGECLAKHIASLATPKLTGLAEERQRHDSHMNPYRAHMQDPRTPDRPDLALRI